MWQCTFVTRIHDCQSSSGACTHRVHEKSDVENFQFSTEQTRRSLDYREKKHKKQAKKNYSLQTIFQALMRDDKRRKVQEKKKQNFHSGTLMAHKRLSSKQFPIQIIEQEQQEISRFDREKKRERKMGKLPTTYRQLVKWNSITLILRSARKKEWKITINLLMASLRWIIFDSILCSHKKWLIMDLLSFLFFFLIRQRSLLPSSVSILGSWAEAEPKLNEIL